MPAVITSRFSFPKVPGDSPWTQADFVGPTSYETVVHGTTTTPPSGGQLLHAKDFALVSFDFIFVMGSENGEFSGVVFPIMKVPGGDAFVSAILMWKKAADGDQVAHGTNLSTHFLRLLALGH